MIGCPNEWASFIGMQQLLYMLYRNLSELARKVELDHLFEKILLHHLYGWALNFRPFWCITYRISNEFSFHMMYYETGCVCIISQSLWRGYIQPTTNFINTDMRLQYPYNEPHMHVSNNVPSSSDCDVLFFTAYTLCKRLSKSGLV